MKRYLHLFDLDTKFNSEYNDDEKYYEPWVSMTEDVERVDYNKKEEPLTYTRTITYIDRGNSATTTDTQTGNVGEAITFTLPSAPTWDAEHECIGWSTEEYPTYEQSATTGFIKAGGSQFETSEDVTLYADYLTTFQGLINEGYVTLNAMGESAELGVAHSMSITPNGYPKEFVVDFLDVFNSVQGKRVSLNGVVGEGTMPNAFTFNTPVNYASRSEVFTDKYWLSCGEWYDLYNDTNIPHYPVSQQFVYMDWSAEDDVILNYNGGSSHYIVARQVIGCRMPKVVNFNMLNGANFDYMFSTFGWSQDGLGAGCEILNLRSGENGKITASISKSLPGRSGRAGFRSLFQGSDTLKEVRGLETSGVTCWQTTFDGASGFEIISTSGFGSEIVIVDTMQQTFRNCYSLREIQPVLRVSAVTETYGAFDGDSLLETVYLNGINAAKNENKTSSAATWDLSACVSLSQASVDYMIASAVTADTGVSGFIYKVINLPSAPQVSVTQQQVDEIYDKGWIIQIGGVEQQRS